MFDLRTLCIATESGSNKAPSSKVIEPGNLDTCWEGHIVVRVYLPVHPLGGMVDGLLKRALQMWEGRSAASKSHVQAEVITPVPTELTCLAGESTFNGDIVSHVEALNILSHGNNGATRLVAET